jgi:hypothetical protein
MKVFVSYTRKDSVLALRLAERLTRAGFGVWIAEDQLVPGENWAKQIGKALDACELMVILLTPRALASDLVRQDIDFALGARKLEGRVFTVFVGSALEADKEVPWILLKLPHCQVESAKEFGKVVKEIRALSTAATMSPLPY